MDNLTKAHANSCVYEPRRMSEDCIRWHVGIFCWNEAERIGACIASVQRAMVLYRPCRITVLLNGSTDGSAAVARKALEDAKGVGIDVALVELGLADKSNAINWFLYNCQARLTEMVFFVDGYVTIDANALEQLDRAMVLSQANAASGSASNGRTEVALNEAASKGGYLRGCLFCLRPSFIKRMVSRKLALPVGLYRGDGLLGHMVCTDLDPVKNARNDRLCIGVPSAKYEIYSLSPWRPSHYRRAWRRKVRQARGLLENLAIASIVQTNGFGALPFHSDRMLRNYIDAHGFPPARLIDGLFLRLAARALILPPGA